MYNPRTSIPFWKRLLKITALTLAFPHSTVCNIVVLWRSETHVIFFHSKQRPIDPLRCVVLALLYTIFSRFVFFSTGNITRDTTPLDGSHCHHVRTHGEFGKRLQSHLIYCYLHVLFLCVRMQTTSHKISNLNFWWPLKVLGSFRIYVILHGWLTTSWLDAYRPASSIETWTICGRYFE